MQSATSQLECVKDFSWVAEDQIDELASDDTPIMPGKIFIYVLNYNPFPTSSTKNGILTRYIADSFLLKATPGTGHPSAPNKFLIRTICGQERELNFSDIDSIWFYTNCSVNKCGGVCGLQGIVGTWSWRSGDTTTFYSDGTGAMSGPDQGYPGHPGHFGYEGITGTWELTDAQSQSYTLIWENGQWIDRVNLAADCNSIDGFNQDGYHVTGQRIQ